ncbi:MAG: hypothetical protein ACI89Z_000359 [Porticoccus sp.]|jgi:hypothetical protein
MRKIDKKIENSLRLSLTEVCEAALENINGFRWLTHFANYDNFPSSLSIVCVFNTNSDLADTRSSNKDDYLRDLIKQKLENEKIKVRDIRQHVSFDTEENCGGEHRGNWQERFREKTLKRFH